MPEKQHEFKVTIDGIPLTAAQRKRIDTAIQQAVLAEIATLRLRDAVVTRPQEAPVGVAITLRAR